MALNKVEICGLDTAKLPMMTQKRSRELLLKIQGGDTEARQTFIQENLRLVLSVIQRFSGRGEQMDDLFDMALEYVIERGQASISMLQRNFKIGFNRAGKIIEDMVQKGYVSPYDGSKVRKVLITKEEYDRLIQDE